MPLPAGERVHTYEIVALLGAGGMGEVYRARDTRLNRDVALKVLPPQMADHPLAFARFEREAQAVAALSHPNILAVHDVGQSGQTRYVVFELLQGATLRERLESGALPMRKAIDYARQIADGLAAAHARNITHRDIKPDNVFVTDDGRVKILDFGLAQTASPAGAADAATSATAAPVTDAGTVLGTVGYMAPEQVRGQAVDHRADIFALGATLFEMCTGRRAFRGATPADTLSAVLTSDPPELALSGHPTPPALDRIVRRCLEKQPGERFQSARDLSFALDALTSLSGSAPVPAEAPAMRGLLLPAAVATLALIALGTVAVRYLSPRSASREEADRPALRAEFPSSTTVNTSVMLELSPDGRRLAYSDIGPDSGVRHLFVRDLATGATTRVEGSEESVLGAWSPQSDALLFATRLRELRRFQFADRTTSVVATLPDTFRGVTWLHDDSIIVCVTGAQPVRRLVPSDGTWTPIVQDDVLSLTRPRRIGRRTDYVLALRGTQARGEITERQIVSVRLADGVMTPLAEAISGAAVAPGYLLLTRLGGLFAVPFDEERVQITGDAVRIADEVIWDAPNGLTSASVSDAGVLAFRPSGSRPLQFEWIDATGRSLSLVGPPDLYGSFSLSPDGGRIVARLPPTQEFPQAALRFIDIARGLVSPITTPPGLVSDPIWTPDGTRIVYRLSDSLMRQSPFSTEAETIRNEIWFPDALSADGRWLLAGRPEAIGGFGLLAMASDGSGEPQPIDTGSLSDEGSFSPDGRLVSYHSARTGRTEIFLSPFPPNGERWQVSPAGGVQPRWSSDGRWLYYLDLAGVLQRAAVAAASPERTGRPETVVDLGVGPPSNMLEQYALHGDRILVLRPAKDTMRESVVVVSNWTALLPKRPAGAQP